MLVLGRNIGDTIVIDDNIYITIFETSPVGNKFKIAIDAPKEMKISRGEGYKDDPERWPKIEAMKAESMRRSKQALKAEKLLIGREVQKALRAQEEQNAAEIEQAAKLG